MQYLILIYSNEADTPPPPTDPKEMGAYMAPWQKYGADMTEAGVMVGGNALQPTSTATTITMKNGNPVMTDGPFAETKEQLGGYYLIECKNLDDALKWGSQCPAVEYGRIEVRPIMDFSQG